MAPTGPECHARLRSIRRSLRAVLLRWLTESGAIAESRDAPARDEDLAALRAAIDAARRREREDGPGVP